MFFRNIIFFGGKMKKTLPEIIALGAYDNALIYKSSTETSPRRVWMYEIESVTENGGITHIDGNSYPIRAGNVIIGKPGQIRHTTLPFKCLYLHIMVDDGELNKILQAMPNVYAPSSPAVLCSLERLIAAYTSPELDAGMQIASELCALLSNLIKDTRLVSGTTHDKKIKTEVIERAIEFMDKNCCKNLTLEEIADHVYLSRIYFHKLFTGATGRTPYRYLLERRLAQAKKLLSTTDLSVGAITRECGFSSQSYFNQIFKREMGCTPIEYKKQMSLQY